METGKPTTPIITFRGVVYPAQCDAMGHMNVQHYVAAFDQAMWHLVTRLGFPPSWVTERREGWADVRYLMDFRKELRAGELFHAESDVMKVGRTSLLTHHRIFNTEREELAAELEMTSVYFDLENRVSRPIPVDIRSVVQQLLCGKGDTPA